MDPSTQSRRERIHFAILLTKTLLVVAVTCLMLIDFFLVLYCKITEYDISMLVAASMLCGIDVGLSIVLYCLSTFGNGRGCRARAAAEDDWEGGFWHRDVDLEDVEKVLERDVAVDGKSVAV